MSPNVPISKRLVLINSVSGGITRVVNLGMMVWLVQHLLRRIDPSEMELLWVVTAFATIAPMFTSLFTFGLARYTTEAYAKGDENRVTQITSAICVALIPAAFLLVIASAIAIWFVGTLLNVPESKVGPARLMLTLLMGQLTLRFALAPFMVGLFVRQQFVRLNFLQLSSTLLRLLLLLVFIFGIGPHVIWVVVAQVASAAAQDIVQTFWSIRFLPALRFHISAIRMETAKEVMGFNAWAFVNQLTNTIRESAGTLMLTHFSSAIDVATWGPASMADRHLRTIVQSTTSPVRPALTAMHATDQHERLRETFLRGGRAISWLIMFLATPLIVWREEIMHIYLRDAYRQYADMGIVLAVLLLTYVFIPPRNVFPIIAQARARLRPVAFLNVAWQSVFLIFALVSAGYFKMGAIGMALAQLASVVLTHLAGWWPVAVQFTGVRFRRFVRETLIRGLAPAATTFWLCELLKAAVHPVNIVPVALCMMFGVAVYLVTLFGFCMMPADKSDVKRIVDRARARIFDGSDRLGIAGDGKRKT